MTRLFSDWVRPFAGRVSSMLTVALIFGCAEPPAPLTPSLQTGIFWAGARWNVERYFVADGLKPVYYCVATTGTKDSVFGIMENAGGTLAWGISNKPATAPSAPIKTGKYSVDLTFEGGPTLHFDAGNGASGFVVSLNPADDPVRQNQLAQSLKRSKLVTITSLELGRLGRFDLSGAPAAFDQLDACVKATLPK